METWLRLPLHRAPQSYHLALTEVLLHSAAERPPVLSWQMAEPAALVIGISQKLSDLDSAACRAAGVAIYRRGAGGTAVLAGPDLLSLDVILPPGHPLAGHDIVEAYRWFGDLWAEALQEMGLAAQTIAPAEAHAPRTRSLLAQAERLEHLIRQSCYGAVSPYEVCVEQRKVLGLDQVRRRVGFLFQGGLLLRWNAEQVAALLAASPTERPALAAGLRERAAGLEDLLGHAIDLNEIMERFEKRLQQRYAVVLRDLLVPAVVEGLAHIAEQERYRPLPEEERVDQDSRIQA